MRQLYNSLNSRPLKTHNDDINDDNANNRDSITILERGENICLAVRDSLKMPQMMMMNEANEKNSPPKYAGQDIFSRFPK